MMMFATMMVWEMVRAMDLLRRDSHEDGEGGLARQLRLLGSGEGGGETDPGSDKHHDGDGVSTATLVAILVVVFILVALAGGAYYLHVRRQMREQVRDILSTYMPLDDMGDEPGGGTAEIQFTGAREVSMTSIA